METERSSTGSSLRRRARESRRALGAVFRNADLRRLQLAMAGSVTAEWAYTVALAVYAYDFGGAAWVGIVGLIRMLPSAVAAPLGSLLLDRYPRQRVLVFVYAFLSLALAVSAAGAIAGLPGVVLVTATMLTIASSIQRPAEWALRPVLSDSPEQLAACNVAASMVEGVGVFVGPAVAGVLLATTDAGIVFAAGGIVYWLAGFAASRIAVGEQVPKPAASRGAGALGGLKAVAGSPDPRLLVTLFGAQTFVRGALNVLIVVAAIELLRLGDPGVGYLNSAFGAGNLAGAVGALALVGRRRLAAPFGLGLAMWGAPIALVGLWPHPATAIVLLALPGFGNGVLDVAGLTLIQRITPDEILGRVFGVLNGVVMATIAAGSILTPLVIHLTGIRWALVILGGLLPVLAIAAARRLRMIDDRSVVPEEELAILRTSDIFSALPPIALEKIASRLFPLSVPGGAAVFRQGEPGDLFFIVASGAFSVVRDGARVADLGPGDSFGEIALLRDVPRTATVEALEDGVVYSLDRATFIGAVTGHKAAFLAAEALLGRRRAPTPAA